MNQFSRDSSIFASIADQIESDWMAIARPEQLPPPGEWSTWLILAGRGAGKTRTGTEWVRSLAEAASVSRIALVAPTASDARDTVVEGESGLLAIAPNSNRPRFEPSRRRVVWDNGVQATLFSSEEPERLRGPQFGAAYCDEMCSWRNAKATWSNLQFGLRLGRRPRQVVTTTPKPIALLRELIASPNTIVTRGTTYDNRENLAPSFFSQIVKQYEGTRIGRQELNAELLTDVQGALWTRDLIEACRRDRASLPPLKRIVVAIDPAITVSEDSNETGIIVAGLGADAKAYILEDASGKLTPIEWAQAAVNLYRRHKADRIVAEANQGGALVETTIRTVDPNVAFKAVHASRGKVTRAEPIAALSEQHRILFAGSFPALEDELCTFSAGSSDSPDRLDAMVWAATELMVSNTNTGFLDFIEREARATMSGRSDSLKIKMLAPPGMGAVQLFSGRNLTVPPDRIVEMTAEDARPLFAAGWTRITANSPN